MSYGLKEFHILVFSNLLVVPTPFSLQMEFSQNLVQNLMKDTLWVILLNPKPTEFTILELGSLKNMLINVEQSEHVPSEQGKGPDWLFDIDSFSQVFKSLIFSNMESSQEKASSLKDDYRMECNGPSIRFKRPSIDPPSVADAIEASEVRASSSNVTSSSTLEPDNTTVTIDQSTADIEVTATDEGSTSNNVEESSANDSEEAPEQHHNNIDQVLQLDVIPAQRINKQHPLENVIGSVQQRVRTRRKTHEANVCLYSYFLSQVEPKKLDEALQHSGWIEAIQEKLLQF
ncbi:hypothetical protein L1987_18466 [Smallanthus sonchifolius]|uniref:Uncharacterized protein n=1 Tax=Smallanthus sonchifolius TaxID=185202 RepID=A0ACB9J0D1_9ASTR|nr:hypothetical protein L1987_18466 [Smallanthus sonchifolius]